MRLLRTASHVAVASAVNGRVQRRQAGRWAAADQAAAAAAPAPPVAPPPVAPVVTPPPAPAAPAVDPAQRIELLSRLADLHAAGVLTDAEFADQKSRLLA